MRSYVVTLALWAGLSGVLAGVGDASGQEAGAGRGTVCPEAGEVPLDELLRCRARQAAERIDDVRGPGADGLTDQERDSLRSACSRAGLLGSAALDRCEARHLANLERVPRPAGISALSEADSATLMAACAAASAIGPAELRRCQTRLLAEIRPERTPGPGIDNRTIAGPGAASPTPPPPPQNELAPGDVLELQQRLAAVGQNPGPADGLFGPATARAIAQFERSVGQAATGRATLELLEQLRALQPEQQIGQPEEQIARPEPQTPRPEQQTVRPEPQTIRPEPQIVRPQLQIVRPDPQTAQPEPQTIRPEPQIIRPEPQIVESEPEIAEPAPPLPAAQPTPPDLSLDVEPDTSEESPAGPSPALPSAAVEQRVEEPLPVEIYLRAKDTIWLVIDGENSAAFEDPYGAALGAAVAVAPDRLLTNCHVIEALGIISFWQGDFFASAELLDADYENDRCVLVPNKMALSAIADIRRYDELEVGERIFTIGSPSGLEQALGEGVISSLRIDDGRPLIETTAPIAPGSSGGGLFDDQGNLIGITTSPLEDGQQVTFAIAADSFGID